MIMLEWRKHFLVVHHSLLYFFSHTHRPVRTGGAGGAAAPPVFPKVNIGPPPSLPNIFEVH